MKEVVVYSLAGCPYCVRAKHFLGSRGVAFREIDVTGNDAERSAVRRRTGHPTFPQIFVGDTFVGGCDDLLALDRSGRLDDLLA